MYEEKRIALIIPVLNEAENLKEILPLIDLNLIDEVIIADNGSTDDSVSIARSLGANTSIEPRKGYGSTCLKAISSLETAPDVLLFMDGDGSDQPSDAHQIVEALVKGNLDLVIGSRVKGKLEPGALTPIQQWGNLLTCSLVKLFWGIEYSDLGPFRAITWPAYQKLNMADPDFGWTIEMQVKAAQQGLRIAEVPVDYGKRYKGTSKVSGSIKGSFLAGKRILSYVFQAKFEDIARK